MKVTVTYISKSSNFTLYVEGQLVYKNHTFQLCVSITQTLTLTYNSQSGDFALYFENNTVYTNTILSSFESVWAEVQSQNKWRSE